MPIPWRKPTLTKQIARGLKTVYNLAFTEVERNPNDFPDDEKEDAQAALEWLEKLQRWADKELNR